MPRCATPIVAGAAWLAVAAARAEPPIFEVLPSVGPDPGSSIVARGISGDGQIIAGSQLPLMWERPFIWRKVDGEWVLTELPKEGSFGWGRPIALSYTGDTIAGMTNQYLSGAVAYGTPAVWTNVLSGTPTLISPLDAVPTALRRGCFSGISSDGAVIAGYAQLRTPTSSLGEIWTFTGGAAGQLSPPSTTVSHHAALLCGNVVSADGSTIVGSSWNSTIRTAFCWTAAGGFVSLPTPTSGPHRHSRAECISRDGAVIGGHLGTEPTIYNTAGRPCVWVEGVRIDLPLPSAYTDGRVFGLSGDGAIAAGAVYRGILGLDILAISDSAAVMWLHGRVELLSTYLGSRGVDLQDITPNWITGIADDGRTLAGFGTNVGTSRLIAFRVVLPTVCEGDLSEDGLTDFADCLLFLNYYEAQDIRADFTGDARVDFGDYLEFLNLYEQGC